MNTKISGAVVSLTLLVGVGGYLDNSNDVTINENVEFDSQEEFEQIKGEMTDSYFDGTLTLISDGKNLGAMIKYAKGEDFQRIKEELRGKKSLTLAERQLLIAVIQTQQEIRQEAMILIEQSEEDVMSEIDKYLNDL